MMRKVKRNINTVAIKFTLKVMCKHGKGLQGGARTL